MENSIKCRCGHTRTNHDHLGVDGGWCGYPGCECTGYAAEFMTAIEQGNVNFFEQLQRADEQMRQNGVRIQVMEWE